MLFDKFQPKLHVPSIKLFAKDGFKKGMRVCITIEEIKQEGLMSDVKLVKQTIPVFTLTFSNLSQSDVDILFEVGNYGVKIADMLADFVPLPHKFTKTQIYDLLLKLYYTCGDAQGFTKEKK